MPQWFDEVGDLPVILTIVTAFFGAVLWVINMKVSAIKHEVRPNSGASLRDSVDRIEQHIIRVDQKLDGHVNWHITHKE